MAINLNAVGQEWEAGTASWNSKDALLYALGVGAGQDDPALELAYTTENSAEVAQVVLPTFLVTLIRPGNEGPSLGDYSMTQVLHGSQSLHLHRPIPASGTVSVRARVERVLDKGKDAVIEMVYELADAATASALGGISTSIFVRGEGGFGGDRGSSETFDVPDREADWTLISGTRPEQALLYRLSGDRNPLHSDPAFAARAGFPRPILHGLCTYGVAARTLLNAVFDGDVTSFGSIQARFASPVMPGEDLETRAWKDGGVVKFVTRVGDRIVLDRGVLKERSDG